MSDDVSPAARLIALLDHLGIAKAHIATQVPADIAGLVTEQAERLGGIVLCTPVRLDPAPFTDWITACGIEDAQFTTMAREIGRPVPVDEVRPHALGALAEVFDLDFDELPAEALAALTLESAPGRPVQRAAVSK